VTRDFLKGDFRAVRNRCIDIERWLAESDARAALLARVSDPANYVIPVGVTHIVPLVCSAFPEYLLELTDAMCLSVTYGSNITARVPRVCTYPGLVYVIQNINRIDLDDKCFHQGRNLPEKGQRMGG
jgi:hypothetical protein